MRVYATVVYRLADGSEVGRMVHPNYASAARQYAAEVWELGSVFSPTYMPEWCIVLESETIE